MNFKEFYLTEVHFIDISEYIFTKTSFLPLSTPMIKRVFGSKKIISFHSTEPKYINDLIKLEGSKKAISTFTLIDDIGSLKRMFTGVATNGGVVVELEGNILLYSPLDVMANVDSQGRRWVVIDNLPDYDLKKKLDDKIKSLKNLIFKKYNLKTENDKDVTIDNIDEIKIESSLKAKIIKDYFSGIEHVLKLEDIKKLFMDMSSKKLYFEYNEIVMNEIKIKKFYILAGHESNVPFGLANKYDIEWITPNEMNKLFSHINKIGGK